MISVAWFNISAMLVAKEQVKITISWCAKKVKAYNTTVVDYFIQCITKILKKWKHFIAQITKKHAAV